MFTYFHAYMPETWEGQIKAGLINAQAGIRFCQNINQPQELKFNLLAQKGGALYQTVKENRMPLYIDRLQGGDFIQCYPYDMALVDAYKDMLGDRFLGFQMHEWMSNYRHDIEKLTSHGCPAWTPQAIEATIRKAYPFPHLFLEAVTAEEMAMLGNPESFEAFFKNAQWLFEDRQRDTGGYLLPCDSYFQADHFELLHGARYLMPEVGHQTKYTRLQLAYARGMSRAYGTRFGAYYEPWGGSPFSVCTYHRDARNEWGIGNGNFPFKTLGENGGSSRSLQRRIHLYAYFAGASFISEEWGMCNTFYDWHDFELSPYGRVKLDFIRLTERYPDIGTPLTPIAVVLPKDLMQLPDLSSLDGDRDVLAGFPITGAMAEQLRPIRRALYTLFADCDSKIGTETGSLTNCKLPDALDILHEDKFCASDYQYFVDLTGSPAFASKYASRICAVEDVADLLDRLLPCICRGSAMKQLTRCADGSYYLLLTNNRGVERTAEKGELLLPEADSAVTVTPKDGLHLTALEGDGTLHRSEDGRYTVALPAGGWFLGRLAK